MAIQREGVAAINVGDLIKENLRIPHYQRPYSWEPATALQLLNDIQESRANESCNGVSYVLGAVILHKCDDGVFDVVDGQQRLLTLRMLTALLGLEPNDRLSQLFQSNADSPVAKVWRALDHRIQPWPSNLRNEVLNYLCERCKLVRIVTNDLDEAFRVFDSQNYRGKPLAPHDLLKAHHLREMRDDTAAMRAAVVEAWESVTDEDLDRLFSIYLYRIVRWSRGESAPGFSTKDIGMFKGISPKRDLPPNARYHLAAQSVLPVLNAWSKRPYQEHKTSRESWNAGTKITSQEHEASRESRNACHSRFQLDAPLVAGRPFFEMVSFMLGEVILLANMAFGNGKESFTLYAIDALQCEKPEARALLERPSRSRYRYVTELYLAALLYYTNRFGNDDFEIVSKRLFEWAYWLRVQKLRVQFRSVDNYARGESPVFTRLRDASSKTVIHELSSLVDPPSDNHEVKLVKLLKAKGL